MKVKDIIKAQKKYAERKQTIEAMRIFKDKVWQGYHCNEILGSSDAETSCMINEFEDRLERDIERLKDQLNEMEV